MSYYYRVTRWTRVVKYLIITNAITFLVTVLVRRGHGPDLNYILGLVPKLVWSEGQVWLLFTYMFLHGDVLHLFFNMFVLWMFGSELEHHMGSRRFLKYYGITGVGAGILTLITSPTSLSPTVGASGAIYGLLLAYALYFPNRLIYLWFLVPIKAKHLVIILGAVEFYAAFSYTSSGIAHFAHLGGILIGFLYLKGRRLRPLSRLRQKSTQRWISRREEEMGDLQAEVDRILDKISEQGIEGLTESERRILDRASQLYDEEIS
jgi:membrane associated rhomboid family serine protease